MMALDVDRGRHRLRVYSQTVSLKSGHGAERRAAGLGEASAVGLFLRWLGTQRPSPRNVKRTTNTFRKLIMPTL